MAYLSLLKAAVYRLPLFGGVLAERSQLRDELEATALARDVLRRELEATTSERDQLRRELEGASSDLDSLRKACGFVPPGHFYSPIPSIEHVRKNEATVFAAPPRSFPGIELNESEQLVLLNTFAQYYKDMPFQAGKMTEQRYYFENPAYSYSDAVMLYCMIRHVKPRRIIEVGSGFSSCATLDTNERHFENAIEVTFIEPYPELLNSLMKEDDKNRVRVIPYPLQEVSPAEFLALEANDILFIDSTHVSKIDSDVNHLFFDILPSLASGVYVHIHDIFGSFEYPASWIYEGKAWNEIYLLRAFLQFNSAFKVVLMNTFMEHFHRDFFAINMPLCLENLGGSIWLRKC